jgi:hypothetical protein
MGERARKIREDTERTIRDAPLTDAQRSFLRDNARYEGSPLHKKEPNNFGLIPPTSPQQDKTLCDEAGILEKQVAIELFERTIEVGLVSAKDKSEGFPAQMWVVDDNGRVFEMIYGGSHAGRYHGYPIRRSNPLFAKISTTWAMRRHG